MTDEPVDRQALHDEMERARATFHKLLDGASDDDLRRPSNGTRWNNEQLLFHMLFGYLLVRRLLVLVRAFGRLPPGASRAFARLLNSVTRPYDVVNYWGSWGGGKAFTRKRLGTQLDRILATLHERLEVETEADLRRGMHFPVRWDPFFADFMTLEDVYHFATQHFDFHRHQLTLNGSP